VPGRSNLVVATAPGSSEPESNNAPDADDSNVTVWGARSSFCHLTSVPAATVVVPGQNVKLAMTTRAASAGGAAEHGEASAAEVGDPPLAPPVVRVGVPLAGAPHAAAIVSAATASPAGAHLRS
jgi:hypothetical protein